MSETSTAQINGGYVLALEDHVSVPAGQDEAKIFEGMQQTVVAEFHYGQDVPICEVRPHSKGDRHVLHWIGHVDGREPLVWAWDSHSKDWHWYDHTTGEADGYSGRRPSTGAEDAYGAGYRYLAPATYFVPIAALEDAALSESARDELGAKNARIATVERDNAKLEKDRDFWKDFAAGNLDMLAEERHYREAERVLAMEITEAKNARIAELESMCAELSDKRMIADAGNHDYNGPVKDGKAVPDVAHERFHGAIGDVLAGKIITSARRQMQEALKQAPKDAPTTASTSRPMPDAATKLFGDPRRMGLA